MMFISENQLHQVLGLSMTRGTLLYRVPHPGCKRRLDLRLIQWLPSSIGSTHQGSTHYM